MKYTPRVNLDTLAVITHGSHLYGTSTPDSDWDFKAVYLPPLADMIRGVSLKVHRYKHNADGTPLGENASMPPGGFEVEYTPVQKFFQDYLDGQAYAVEFIYGVKAGAHLVHAPAVYDSVEWNRHAQFVNLCKKISEYYVHANVQSMVGFALKQTFDYVQRAERMDRARAVLALVDTCIAASGQDPKRVRLDYKVTLSGQEFKILDYLIQHGDLGRKTLVQHEREVPTLVLNDRDYMETSPLWDFRNAVVKLIDKYGERVKKVATDEDAQKTEWKSMSHAVRVFQQVLEVLRVGNITFPRKNVQEILAIKMGQVPKAVVGAQLKALIEEVDATAALTTLPLSDEKFRDRANRMFNVWLHDIYIR